MVDGVNVYYISYGIILILFLSLHFIIKGLKIFLAKRYTNLDDKKLLALYEDENLDLWFYNLAGRKVIKVSKLSYLELEALRQTMENFNLHRSDGHVYEAIQNRNMWSDAFKAELIQNINICLAEKEKYLTRGVILMAFVLLFAVTLS